MRSTISSRGRATRAQRRQSLILHYFSQFFVYDGANQVLALGADGTVTDRYLWGPGVNQLLADDNYALGLSSPTLWALGDNQNSIRDLVSSDGTLQQHIAYSPFGQQIVTAAGAYSHGGRLRLRLYRVVYRRVDG